MIDVRWKKILSFFAAVSLVTASFFVVFSERQPVGAATVNSSVTVSSTPSVCGNGSTEWGETCDDGANNGVCGGYCNLTCDGVTSACSGGPPPTDNAPSISNASSTASFTTAAVSWSASDDNAVASGAFVYGTSTGYGLTGSISGTYGGTSGNYSVSLTGLSDNTLYYYRISVTDNAAQTTYFTGSFSTGLAPDTTPPIIMAVSVEAGSTTATVRWNTNESADSRVDFGISAAYGSTYIDSARVLAHSAFLFNLLPNTVYHYKIFSTDAAGNSANTSDAVFTTIADDSAPPDVSNLTLTRGDGNSFILSWTNPNLVTVPDFAGVKVARKVGSQSASASDGTLVYTGTGETITDGNLDRDVNYFYTVFSFDTSGNHSGGIFKNGEIPSPSTPVENCSNGTDDDEDGKIDCADEDCSNDSACGSHTIPPENCFNGTDDDEDGKIDCADENCANDSACTHSRVIPPENCSNGTDDDEDGKIDCADSDCVSFSECAVVTPGKKSACSDGADNDDDKKIDYPADPGCENADDDDEYNPPETTVPVFARLNLIDVSFLAGNGQIALLPSDDIVTGLAASTLMVSVSEKYLAGPPRSFVLRVGDSDTHQFVYDKINHTYRSSVSMPSAGETAQAFIEIDYGSEQFDSLGFKTRGLPFGDVLGDKGIRLEAAQVTLYDKGGKKMSMDIYGQANPYITDANGAYGWVVPNGEYYIAAVKEGYRDRATPVFRVDNNVVNLSLKLIIKPPSILESVNPDAGVIENVGNVANNLASQAQEATQVVAQAIQDIASNPEVKKAAPRTAITAVIIGALPLITWVDFLPFLRLLFLQPLMLLGWRKRKNWGLVYNSLNKLPVDLAMLRLINITNNRIVQSKVTDTQGRYLFTVDQGKYRLEVRKNNFVFPSALLTGFKDDGYFVDIYHGEVIEAREAKATITANIPLDPVGEHRRPIRLLLQRIGRFAQHFFAWIGIIVTAGSLYIAPKWYVGVLLAVHVFFYFLFLKLSSPPRPKGWGIVYDKKKKKPIAKVVARLFNSKLNKLVATQITDSDGRYSFLAGHGAYYITYEKLGYEQLKSDVIDLSDKEAQTIAIDVSLKEGGKEAPGFDNK